MEERLPKVLSIQSHVIYGHVGNRAAVFPLQYLGFNVSFINSVQFSNHTHYPAFEGQVLEEKELRSLVNGLVKNGLTHYDYVVTGYCRSASFLLEIRKTVETLRKYNPKMKFVCDPVLGDQGRFYCPAELADLYRSEILPLADLITPNQFELEILTQKKIANEEDVGEALEFCHNLGVKTVVLSSCQFEGNANLISYASSINSPVNGGRKRFRVSFPAIPSQFTGTGDLFTALLVAYIHKFPDSLDAALEKAISVVQAILSLTHRFHVKEMESFKSRSGSNETNKNEVPLEFAGVESDALPWAALELRLIEGRHLLDSSDIPIFKAETISI